MTLPILLVEPNAILRQTVALTASSLALGKVHQVSTMQSAQRVVREQAFSAAILPLRGEGDDAGEQFYELVKSLRSGSTVSPSDIQIYVTTSGCERDDIQQLAQCRVQRVIVKPFKARVLIDTLRDACETAPPASRPAAELP